MQMQARSAVESLASTQQKQKPILRVPQAEVGVEAGVEAEGGAAADKLALHWNS